MEQILVQASRSLTDYSWVSSLAQINSLSEAMNSAANVHGSGEAGSDTEEVLVTAPRDSDAVAVPADVWIYAAYNIKQTGLIESLMQTSVQMGEDAVYHYIDKEVQSGNAWYRVPGTVAALWTPNTAQYTSLLLGISSGLGRWSARPFWQYFPADSRSYRSTWLTRGSGWSPPYQTGAEAASRLSLPAYNPGSAVRAVQPRWYEFIRGPRAVEPQPTFGPHATGGGLEYRVIPFGE